MGGICKEQMRNTNSNFGKAISYLSVLNSLKSDSQDCTCDKAKNPSCEVNQSNCRIFSGFAERCRRYTGEFNCCTKRGLFLHIASCKESEKELRIRRDAGLCHYVGVWKKGKKWWNRFKKKKVFCCFNSKLARIVQEGGRRQLGISWGDPANPSCRALTVGELQRLDFEKIDMSEISYELEAKAQNSYKRNKASLQKKFKDLKLAPEITKGQIYNKMKNYDSKQE